MNCPFVGVSYAEVDTKTEEVGLGAKIEGSNFADEPSKAVCLSLHLQSPIHVDSLKLPRLTFQAFH